MDQMSFRILRADCGVDAVRTDAHPVQGFRPELQPPQNHSLTAGADGRILKVIAGPSLEGTTPANHQDDPGGQ
jgi:hypothetical protein